MKIKKYEDQEKKPGRKWGQMKIRRTKQEKIRSGEVNENLEENEDK